MDVSVSWVPDVLKLRERVLAERAAKEQAAAEGRVEEDSTDMGIYVQDNGEEKVYALTPEAKQWAQNKLKRIREKEQEKEENGEENENKKRWSQSVTRESVEGNPECQECVEEQPGHHDQQEGMPDDETFNKLLANISEDFRDVENFSEYKEAVNTNPTDNTTVNDDDSNISNVMKTEDAVNKSVESKDIEDVRFNDEDLVNKEIEICSYERELVEEMPKLRVSEENTDCIQIVGLNLSRKDEKVEKESLNSSSDCRNQNQDSDDQLLLTSCQNFLRAYTTAEEPVVAEDTVAAGDTKLASSITDCQNQERGNSSIITDNNNEGKQNNLSVPDSQDKNTQESQLITDDQNPQRDNLDEGSFHPIADTQAHHNTFRDHPVRTEDTSSDKDNHRESQGVTAMEGVDEGSEVDSDSEGQAYVRQLVASHIARLQTDSDIEEILESLQFDGGGLATAYRHNNLQVRVPREINDDSDQEEGLENGVFNHRLYRSSNGSQWRPPSTVPLFGDQWLQNGTDTMMEDADWQEEIESSTTSDEDGSVDEFNVETPEETSMCEESSCMEDGSQASMLEEESLSSASPPSSKHEEPLGKLKRSFPLSLGWTADLTLGGKGCENTSSSSSLSLSPLSDSPPTEMNHPTKVSKSCNVKNSEESCHTLVPTTSHPVQISGDLTARVSIKCTSNTNSEFDGGCEDSAATDSGHHCPVPDPNKVESLYPTPARLSWPDFSSPHLTSEPTQHNDSRKDNDEKNNEDEGNTKSGDKRYENQAASVRQVRRDRETLAGDFFRSPRRERIYSTRRALSSSHQAFVSGTNFGKAS